MVNSSSDGSISARMALSALMDGDVADRGAVALGAWRDDADARASWHAYHLIGDVLRSDELAVAQDHDEAFLQRLRGRLAAEPLPLAPAPLASPREADGDALRPGVPAVAARRRAVSWLMAPAAVAAGFVAVAGLLVVTRTWSPASTDSRVMAQAASAVAPGAPGLVLSTAVVRDARLDRYLEAHRALGSGAAAANGAEHRVQIVFESK